MKVFTLILCVTIGAVGCTSKKSEVEIPKAYEVPSFGNGVYHFTDRGTFPKDLSRFLDAHPCKIEGMASETSGTGGTLGYIVVCR